MLTDIDILLMVEKGITGGICNAIRNHEEANNKYTKDHDKNEEFSFPQYLDENNLYAWAMSQEFPVGGFKWKKMLRFNERFIKNYNEDSNKGYILEVDVKYPINLHDLHDDLPFLPE